MYLLQERNESCFKCPSINQNPRNHFSHILFTNGNGIEFEDGNPVNIVGFNRVIPWTSYYRQGVPFEETKSYYMDHLYYKEVQEMFDARKSVYEYPPMKMGGEAESRLWDKVHNEVLERINNIKELTLQNITDPDFWYSTFYSNNEYYPRLALSNGYFKLQHFNTNTSPILLSVALALVDAHIKLYTEVAGGMDIKIFKDSYSYGFASMNGWSHESLSNARKATESDLSILLVEKGKLLELIHRLYR